MGVAVSPAFQTGMIAGNQPARHSRRRRSRSGCEPCYKRHAAEAPLGRQINPGFLPARGVVSPPQPL
jgi:hypothetical protein